MELKDKARFQDELLVNKNWKPNLSEISKKLEIPVTTLWDYFNKLRNDCRIELIVRILSESEGHAIKELEEQLEKIRKGGKRVKNRR